MVVRYRVPVGVICVVYEDWKSRSLIVRIEWIKLNHISIGIKRDVYGHVT